VCAPRALSTLHVPFLARMEAVERLVVRVRSLALLCRVSGLVYLGEHLL